MARNKPKNSRGKMGGRVRKPLSLKDLKSLKKVLKTSKLQRIRDTSDTSPISFRKRNVKGKGPNMSGLKDLFKKNPKGYDDKLFKSITGNTVGTAKAFEKAGLEVPDYNYDTMNDSIDSWMKKGGSIKKKMKKTKAKKRPALRGYGTALRGF